MTDKKRRLTLALILQDQQALLLNRYKKPYIGQWNGIGGKIEAGETPELGVQREIFEETGIAKDAYQLVNNGYMEWFVSGVYQNRIYLFTARLNTDYQLKTPVNMREGLLNLFPLDWVLQPQNYGVIADLKAAYPYMIKNEAHRFVTDFSGDQLVKFAIDDTDFQNEAEVPLL
ncbi:NUDIX hydrolase [Agrilactobacillus fermenti]|uniref:NUDIX hydrolase n=1 Tax=Agrilactobacillus fermenti TaxID=2586909 RepID=UPI001E2E387F|nr:NUDIX domain-containing protein [Agrilactobacillus fermenti]MCD2255990.1 NUDIX domain-containing protein [Agrilactobacillus fermenti]